MSHTDMETIQAAEASINSIPPSGGLDLGGATNLGAAASEPARLPQPAGPSHARASTTPALENRINQAIAMALGYLLEVFAGAFRLMIAPLSVLVYFAFLAIMATVLYRALWKSTTEVFCQVPGAGLFLACGGHSTVQVVEPNITMRVDYPALMTLQNDALDRLLVQSNAGSQLALDVKRAEVLVRGLTSYVLHSKLDNKALIASVLTEFVADAKDTGRDLQKLSAKLYGAVASVAAFTEYAGTTISEAKTCRGKIVNPVMQRMFQASMEVLSEQVGLSVRHVASCIARLDRLEESMATIHGVLVKEDILVIEQRNRLAADIWTKLGWNAEELQLHDTHLKLINSVQDYRVQALNHVIGTMQTLEAIDAHLVELQSQLYSPGAGEAKPIPVEVQLATIQDSVHRLRQQMATISVGEASLDGLDHQMRSVHLAPENAMSSFSG